MFQDVYCSHSCPHRPSAPLKYQSTFTKLSSAISHKSSPSQFTTDSPSAVFLGTCDQILSQICYSVNHYLASSLTRWQVCLSWSLSTTYIFTYNCIQIKSIFTIYCVQFTHGLCLSRLVQHIMSYLNLSYIPTAAQSLEWP
jgi:hypothetical protein